MGYPLISAEGTVSSWGDSAGDFYNFILATLNEVSVNFNVVGDDHDIQANAQDYAGILPGLYTIDGSIEGVYRNAAPIIGAAGGLVTLSAGSIPHAYGFDVDFSSINVHDITPIGGSTVGRHFRPDATKTEFNIRARGIDSSTSILPATAAGTLPASMLTVTLRYDDAATDATIAGKARIRGPRVTKPQTGLQTVEYSGVYADSITLAGTNTIFTTPWASAVGIFPWSQDNTSTPSADYTLTVTAVSGKTYAFEAFATNIRISVDVGEPVRVSMNFRGSKGITIS